MAEFGADGTKREIDAPAIKPEAQPDPDIQLTPPDDEAVPETDDSDTDPNAAAIADLATDPADRPEPEPGVTVKAPTPAPEVIDAEPSTAVALATTFDVAETGEVWKHDFLTFEGDRLGIRVPTRQALAAFSLASGKYVDIGVKNDLTGLFIARHLSPESYGRVFSRLMDPDDEEYDVDTVGELFNAIVTASLQDQPDGDDKA